jgi:hypothetical protein
VNNMTGPGLTRWKQTCGEVADRLMVAGKPPPVTTARVDEALAAARDAGFSEQEKGALIMMLTMAEMQQQPRMRRLPKAKLLAVAAAYTFRILESQPAGVDLQ